jgi:hypothetical protein
MAFQLRRDDLKAEPLQTALAPKPMEERQKARLYKSVSLGGRRIGRDAEPTVTLTAEQLASISYEPVETGVLCGQAAHATDCTCDVQVPQERRIRANLDDLPFGTHVARAMGGYPTDSAEFADFLCGVMGLWQEARRLAAEEPERIKAVTAMARFGAAGWEDALHDSIDRTLAYAEIDGKKGDSRKSAAARVVNDALKGGISVEEVCALLDMRPSVVLHLLCYKRGNGERKLEGGLSTMDPDAFVEMDLDCRLGILGINEIAKKWDLSYVTVRNWAKRLGLR